MTLKIIFYALSVKALSIHSRSDFKSRYPKKNRPADDVDTLRCITMNIESLTHNTTSQHHHEIQSKLIEIQFVIAGLSRSFQSAHPPTPDTRPGNSISQNHYHHCRFASTSTTDFNAIMFQVLLYINHPHFSPLSLRGRNSRTVIY